MAIFKKKNRQLQRPDKPLQQVTEDVVLKVDDLTVTFEVDGDVVEAVTDVSFEVKKGKTLGLVGETGAGKTTTALACLNLIPDPPGIIKNGQIYVCGEEIRIPTILSCTHSGASMSIPAQATGTQI